ncbi:MAG: hypothetical protein JWN32_4263, partial [Solirubrobacterales bacterium]|nr:hypothetical protein [Solirubrobacterales bacterium]
MSEQNPAPASGAAPSAAEQVKETASDVVGQAQEAA